jgi:hypothetical protein
MKQKTLYIFLVVCLIIISILFTLLISNYQKSYSKDNKNNIINKAQISINKPQNYNYPDIDYAYDYDGYWFQPSRWWNNLWSRPRYNYYDSRYNYDRHDGLDFHNRYNKQTHQPPSSQPPPLQPPPLQPPPSQPPPLQPTSQPPLSQPTIALVRYNTDFPLPTLSSSLPIMPEEIAMAPMSHISQNEDIIQTISTFVSDLPESYQSDYISNFTYKGSDPKNQKPLPIDIMASESIYLQPNTIANQIVIPPIVMEHSNPN